MVVSDSDASRDPAGGPVQPIHNGDGIAFLQYTSGSTGAPKGTVITHASLIANLAAIQALFQHDPAHEVVTWLPPYHDMGLIGCLLTPLYRGMTVTLLSPDEFLRKPVRWLQVISSRHALVSSGAPNFAYQLLAERVAEEELATLDLSRWRIAFNGAEPVQAGTLERFTQRFAPCGFRAEAWLPCYGLAETTLLTAGGCGSPGILPVDRTALEQGRFAPGTDDACATPLVSCGPPAWDTRITIHDSETNAELPEDRIGEIHVHSPSVARGYWRDDAATAAAFPQPRTLRTGDLGFLHEGELYVTGRAKDLIIIRGRNLYPHDVETCVAAQLPAAAGANSIAAFEFSGNGSGSGALGLLIEAPRTWVSGLRKAEEESESRVRRIREAVAEMFEVTADLIAFVAPGDFPRTSSGKVQRSACRDGVLGGSLPVVYRDHLSASPTAGSGHIPVADPINAGGHRRFGASRIGGTPTGMSPLPGLRRHRRRPHPMAAHLRRAPPQLPAHGRAPHRRAACGAGVWQSRAVRAGSSARVGRLGTERQRQLPRDGAARGH
jgi:acyl-CoA synthetase (AMP-forming)/AMP-acid ligase II